MRRRRLAVVGQQPAAPVRRCGARRHRYRRPVMRRRRLAAIWAASGVDTSRLGSSTPVPAAGAVRLPVRSDPPPVEMSCSSPIPLALRGWMMVDDPYGTLDGTFARRGQVAHIRLGSSWDVTFGMFGFDLCFDLVAFDFVSVSTWCKGVGVGVGARRGSTWPGGDFLRGARGWEKWSNRRTTNKARSQKHQGLVRINP